MPNRYLREEIITSRWNRCSWMAQSLYVRLLGLVCDYGRYEADPTILCAQAFPTYPHFRTATVRKLLDELAEKGLISLYAVDGKPYLQILRWRERVRQRKPKYPGPSSDVFDANRTIQGAPPQKVAGEDARNAHKQTSSASTLLTDARHATDTCPPPTPNALALQPKHISSPKRLNGIPSSVEEVIAYGQSLGIPEAQCRAFWAHYEGQARTNENGDIFWITSGEAVVTNWKIKLPQFRPLHEQHRSSDKRGVGQRPDRNIGTANEGNHTKYGNIGKVARA
jgi:hypothetical protein